MAVSAVEEDAPFVESAFAERQYEQAVACEESARFSG